MVILRMIMQQRKDETWELMMNESGNENTNGVMRL